MHEYMLGLCLLDNTHHSSADFAQAPGVLVVLLLQVLKLVPFSAGFTSCLFQTVSSKPCLLSSLTTSGKPHAMGLPAVCATSALDDVEYRLFL